MIDKSENDWIRMFAPSRIFFYILVVFLWLPSLVIYFVKFYDNLWISASYDEYNSAALLFLSFTSVSLFFFLIGSFFFKSIYGLKRGYLRNHGLYKNFSKDQVATHVVQFQKKSVFFIHVLFLFSFVFLLIYILSGGMAKLYLLGSDLGKAEFRFAETFSDDNYGSMVFLQIARRVFMPLVVVIYYFRYVYSQQIIGTPIPKSLYALSVIVFLISALITLDRAPLITFIIVFAYLFVLKTRLDLFFYFKVLGFLLCVMLLGATMTYVQHNILEFSFSNLLYTGYRFLWHRIWAAPAVVGIELSAYMFPFDSEKLNLQFSRIMVLFGRERVGSQGDFSIYVGPVSYVGDIWRNLGYPGIASISFLLGALFTYLDLVSRSILLPYAMGLGILVMTFAFYLTHGVFFSMGVFFQLAFILVYSKACMLMYRSKAV